MRAGTMRDRIVIQRRNTSADPRWGEVGEWDTVKSVWASVTPTTGLEQYRQAEGVQSEITHVIRTRFGAGVTPQSRIKYRDRVLDVVSVVDVDGLREELLIEAKEHPAEGGADA